ncbi:MAG: 16S rRNA (guanine(966)-N(2))-methyltransferase RsmD [Proteobacteria bacterium]|nr:16S rRNA (guanine(966)-N(2))-methyltransferase RsmD [Pseudomonadota bacterium]
MRVTGGELGGRRLAAPPVGVRPTSDRVRESLFAWLGDVAGARVLDLYAGTGTLGIEALSRGAEQVRFVEKSSAALAALERNRRQLGLAARTDVWRGDVLKALRRAPAEGERCDLVLLDPPYAAEAAPATLAALVAHRWLRPFATVVVEGSKRHPVHAVAGLELAAERRYGDTMIWRFAPVNDGSSLCEKG